MCIDNNKKALEHLEEELNNTFDKSRIKSRVFFYEADISFLEQVKFLCQEIKKKFPKIDIIINNAGIMNKAKTLLNLEEVEIFQIFKVNILSQIWICREFLPEMIEQNKGHIVNISSSLGIFGAYKLTDYCTTKFAVIGFTEALRMELKTLNPNNQINVTLVCPFHVKTNLFNGFQLPRLKW